MGMKDFVRKKFIGNERITNEKLFGKMFVGNNEYRKANVRWEPQMSRGKFLLGKVF